MKRALAVAALLLCAAPALAERTWMEVKEWDPGLSRTSWIDMRSVVVKDGVAFFNIGKGEGTHLPKGGDIYSSFINCRQRTNSDGVYIPAPIDEEWMVLREGRQYAELELNWIESFSQRIKLVCPANITSKDFNEASKWIRKDKNAMKMNGLSFD
ncbi:MAG: hypothetical protein VXY74_17780 [SAR324 cluster bacterium]|nr:hypothetical protein [SAR324 cluster bacterium]